MQAYSASLRGKFASQTLPPPYECYLICFANIAPALRMLPYMQCISVAIYFTSANRTVPYPPRWQTIFIPAQGSLYTTKTVGGESSPTVFSLKYAVLLYTISTLFRELSLRQQKSFRKVFCQAFFQKSVNASPRPSHPLTALLL